MPINLDRNIYVNEKPPTGNMYGLVMQVSCIKEVKNEFGEWC